jgi:hypothetical protein
MISFLNRPTIPPVFSFNSLVVAKPLLKSILLRGDRGEPEERLELDSHSARSSSYFLFSCDKTDTLRAEYSYSDSRVKDELPKPTERADRG